MTNHHIHTYSHEHPIWGSRSDTEVVVYDEDQTWRELLPARRVEGTDYLYEVCALPLFAYDICLGDTVRTNDDRVVMEVVETRGRYGFRIFIQNDREGKVYEDVVKELQRHKCSLELNTVEYFGVDVENESVASHVAGILAKYEDKGLLQYETVRT